MRSVVLVLTRGALAADVWAQEELGQSRREADALRTALNDTSQLVDVEVRPPPSASRCLAPPSA